MPFTRLHTLFLCISCALAVGAVSVCSAQTQAVPSPVSKRMLPVRFNLPCTGRFTKQSLSDILSVLTTQCNINALVDGDSIRKQADFDFKGSVAQALDSIGEAFDCDWSVNKRGIVLLRRRFTAPGEMPQMHLAEMQQMTTDVFKALRLIPVDTEFGHQYLPLDKTIGTLTPQQRRLLLGGGILKARDLRPDQQTMLEEALVTSALSPAYPIWDEARATLNGLPLSYITARRVSADPANTQYMLLHISREKGRPIRTTVLQNIFVQIGTEARP